MCRPFPHQLENSHIITPDQIFCAVAKVGPTGTALNSSFQQRDSEAYKQELGRAILEAAKVIPDGLLVFFPSYSVMNSCLEFWRGKRGGTAAKGERTTTCLYDQIAAIKTPVVEPQAKGELKAVFQFAQHVHSLIILDILCTF